MTLPDPFHLEQASSAERFPSRLLRVLGLLILIPALGTGSPMDDAHGQGILPQFHSLDLGRLAFASGAHQDPPQGQKQKAQAEIRASITRGLDFLAARQALVRDGSLPVPHGEQESPIGVTALGALAYMAGGSTPTRGPHAAQLVRALEYLLAHQAPITEANPGWISAAEDRQSRAHGHGLATLALSQAHSLSPRSPLGKRIGQALASAVHHIEGMQGPDGGWYYGPGRTAEQEGSVTVCLVQALRGARNAGLRIKPKVISHAVEYVKELQDETGGFRYSQAHPQTSVALTAACLATLHATGTYEGQVIDKGYDSIWRKLEGRKLIKPGQSAARSPAFPYYERLYLAQALWQHPDTRQFKRWAKAEVLLAISDQRSDGGWEDIRQDGRGETITGRYGTTYATAMNCLFLSVPEGLLPIFRR